MPRPDAIGDVGHALMELARDQGADLAAMGCYGHSRVLEMLFGGAARRVLMPNRVPVFMSA